MKLVFFEPHHTGGDAKIVITSEKAIEYQKKQRDYSSDEEAFLDFISIHWAFEEKEDKMKHTHTSALDK